MVGNTTLRAESGGTENSAAKTDADVLGLWLDYDPQTFQLLGGASGLVMPDGATIALAGAFGPWGYAARIAIPTEVRRFGRLVIRAAVNIISGSVCIGILDESGRGFHRQSAVSGIGMHFLQFDVDCADPPSGVILRHGLPEPGKCEFELKMLAFQLRCGSSRANLKPAPKRSTFNHHPVFNEFPRWSGKQTAEGHRNWLGILTRSEFSDRTWTPPPGITSPALPSLSEEYFEWIDLLEAVHESSQRFTMVELGAGWGRWLMNAWGAIKQSGKMGLEILLVGVEAEPQHFAWMQQHFIDNEVPESQSRLIEAAVSTQDGTVNFLVGNSASHYGQSIVSRPYQGPFEVREVRSVSLDSVLADIDSVDLLDMDIQGAEADVVESSRALLDARVKRVHIGTHSELVENRLRQTLGELGWHSNYDFQLKGLRVTPFGPVEFHDGVQSWSNLRLVGRGSQASSVGAARHAGRTLSAA